MQLVLILLAYSMCFAYADEKISEEEMAASLFKIDLKGTVRILPPVPPPTLDRREVIEDITLHTKNYFKHALEHAQHLVVQLYQVMKNLDEYSDDIVLKVENATGSAILWNGRVLHTTDTKVHGRNLQGRRRLSIGSLVKRSIFINEILLHLNREMECLWKYYTSIERKRVAIGNRITSSPYGPHGEHPKHWVANGSFPIVARVHKNLTELLMAQDLLLADLDVGSAVDPSMVLENTLAKQLQVAYLSLMGNVNDAARKIRDLVVLLVKMNRCTVAFLNHPSGVWKRFDPASF